MGLAWATTDDSITTRARGAGPKEPTGGLGGARSSSLCAMTNAEERVQPWSRIGVVPARGCAGQLGGGLPGFVPTAGSPCRAQLAPFTTFYAVGDRIARGRAAAFATTFLNPAPSPKG